MCGRQQASVDVDVKWFGNRAHDVFTCRRAIVPCVRLLCKQRLTSCLRWRTNRTNGFYLFTIYKLKLNSVWWFVTCKFLFYRSFAVCRRHLFSVANVSLMCILPRYICPVFCSFFFRFRGSSSYFSRTLEMVCEIAFYVSFEWMNVCTFVPDVRRKVRREWQRQSHLFKFCVRFFGSEQPNISGRDSARYM